jgi:hypothetical protein
MRYDFIMCLEGPNWNFLHFSFVISSRLGWLDRAPLAFWYSVRGDTGLRL